MDLKDWTEQFEGTRKLPRRVRDMLLDRSRIIRAPAGRQIFGPGHMPDNLLFLLEGRVRVSQTSESGREIVLYRVEAGQSCVMTTACILAHEAYTAEGIAETDVVAVAIPRSAFDDLVCSAPEFRDFVFTAYAQRITDLLRVIDEVAFGRMDMRLAARLVALGGDGNVLHVTHQQLATELGSAREVISRQLHEFQRRGWVRQTRGQIELLDRAALAGLAEAA